MKIEWKGLPGPARRSPEARARVTRGVPGGAREAEPPQAARDGGRLTRGRGRGCPLFLLFPRGRPRAFGWCPPPGPRATEPRGRILTCQTRPGRVYNAPAVAPGAAASPALRRDSGLGTRSPRRAPESPAPARTRTRAHTRSPALPLAHALTHPHSHTRSRARSSPLTLQGRRPRGPPAFPWLT